MAGTSEGARATAAARLAKDPDFYSKIGKRGGAASRTGGFFANRELASRAGQKGGRSSRPYTHKPRPVV